MRHGILTSLIYEGWEACVAAGLNLERWAQWDYERAFMVKVIAWYRLHNLVEAHIQDAVYRKQKLEAKRKGRRR